MRLNEPADLLTVTDTKVRRSVFSAVSVHLMRAKLETYSAWPRRRDQRARRTAGRSLALIVPNFRSPRVLCFRKLEIRLA